MPTNPHEASLDVAKSFHPEPFSTADFYARLKQRFPDLVISLVARYGAGGRGSGRSYTVYSWAGQTLKRLADRGLLTKLGYSREPPDDWGSPVIMRWQSASVPTVVASNVEYPDDVGSDCIEGAKKTITVNAYERDPKARGRCIEHWGTKCTVCSFDFAARYGDLGAGFIHVHHLTPLSTIGQEYVVDPIKDLRPVCPNCHAMLHRGDLSPDELRGLLEK